MAHLTRRRFLKGLAAVAGAVAAIGIPPFVYRQTEIRALLQRKIRETEARMHEDMNQLLWGDGSSDFEGGLRSLISDDEYREIVAGEPIPRWRRILG